MKIELKKSTEILIKDYIERKKYLEDLKTLILEEVMEVYRPLMGKSLRLYKGEGWKVGVLENINIQDHSGNFVITLKLRNSRKYYRWVKIEEIERIEEELK